MDRSGDVRASGAPATLPTGAACGPYTVEALRGRGGFAAVYRAHDAGGAVVALKVLHAFLGGVPEALARFAREIETLRRLDHANIVRWLGAGELDGGRPWLAMEWVEGETLEDRLRRGRLPLAEVVALAEPIAAALAAAHAIGVVHRDLKAGNVLLAADGAPASLRLVDFGIAKLLEAAAGTGADLTATGLPVGTPHAMAPEQLGGGEVGPATDVYAFGVLLFQLLTGRAPFEGETAAEIAAGHLAEPPPLASLLAPLPGAVDDVIARCLEKDPAARFASAFDVARELRAAAELDAGTAPHRPRSLRAETRDALAVAAHGVPAAALEGARRACLGAGFVPIRAEPALLLAVRLLPVDPTARPPALAAARGLVTALEGTKAASVARQEGVVRVLVLPGGNVVAGGPLLDLDHWD